MSGQVSSLDRSAARDALLAAKPAIEWPEHPRWLQLQDDLLGGRYLLSIELPAAEERGRLKVLTDLQARRSDEPTVASGQVVFTRSGLALTGRYLPWDSPMRFLDRIERDDQVLRLTFKGFAGRRGRDLRLHVPWQSESPATADVLCQLLGSYRARTALITPDQPHDTLAR